jgi:hypothetical protein
MTLSMLGTAKKFRAADASGFWARAAGRLGIICRPGRFAGIELPELGPERSTMINEKIRESTHQRSTRRLGAFGFDLNVMCIQCRPWQDDNIDVIIPL